jgi:hypothetical protein
MREFGLKPADVRVNRRGLFEALRVYDALTMAALPPTEAAKVLDPDAFSERGDPDVARKKVNDLRQRSQVIDRGKGYLKLVSRDYIEDRSKTGKR